MCRRFKINNMITDKEYPATHSMATSWYCVDEDGNVGIFDIDDNGPVPVGEYRQNCVDEVFYEDFTFEEAQFKRLQLSPDQITQMLEPMDMEDVWEESDIDNRQINVSWMEVIVQIDMDKFDIFKKAHELDESPYHPLVCLSEELGLFYADFFDNKAGVDLLEQNDVVKAKFKAPHFEYTDEDDKEEQEKIEKENKKFPVYIYRQNYWPFHDPAIRVTCPKNPLKIDQLPNIIKRQVKTLPVRFSKKEKIQLAELLPVDSIWSIGYVYDNKIWWELASSDGGTIYYNESTNVIIQKQEMDRYIDEGLAEEWDYDKHKEIKR